MSEQPKKSVYELLLDNFEVTSNVIILGSQSTSRLSISDIFMAGSTLVSIMQIIGQMIVPEEYYKEIIDRLHKISAKITGSKANEKLAADINGLADRISAEHEANQMKTVQETEELERIARS